MSVPPSPEIEVVFSGDKSKERLVGRFAEEILRQLRNDDPTEYDRIAALRDGIRTVRPSLQGGMYVFCQAGRFQQLFLLDQKGDIVSRDIPKVAGAVKRELNQLRRTGVAGENLLKHLIRIYDQHSLKDVSAQRDLTMADRAAPRVICSEAFVL
jgi:hypothetical protein